MASEAEFSSLIERLINSRNSDLSLFLPFILALTDLPETINNQDQDSSSSPDQETSQNQRQTTREPRDRIILINPLTQGMVVIEGGSGSGDGSSSSSSSLDLLMRYLLNKTGQPPASKASIEALPVVEIDKDGEEECVICLEEWEEVGGMAKEMPCKHKFHGECIEKWLKIHGSCPVCRYKMPVENNVDKIKINEENTSGRRMRELWVSFSFARDSSSNSSLVVDQDTHRSPIS